MKKNYYRILVLVAVLVAGLMFGLPNKAYALNVTPVDMELYAISGTPVYGVPDVYTNILVTINRFTLVKVTGITDNGFYRIDLNGAYYVPGAFLISNVAPQKTEKQKALENLDKLTDAYMMILGHMQDYTGTFALLDVTGDGVPELFDSVSHGIYTYYDEKPVMMYYYEFPTEFYYSKAHNQMLGKYNWNGINVWELYYKDVSLLPWGQFKCNAIAAPSAYDNAVKVTYEYTYPGFSRTQMYNTLKKILSL